MLNTNTKKKKLVFKLLLSQHDSYTFRFYVRVLTDRTSSTFKNFLNAARLQTQMISNIRFLHFLTTTFTLVHFPQPIKRIISYILYELSSEQHLLKGHAHLTCRFYMCGDRRIIRRVQCSLTVEKTLLFCDLYFQSCYLFFGISLTFV